MRVLVGHTGDVRTLAFGTDDDFVYSGSSDKTIRVWNRYTGKLLRTIEGVHDNEINALAFGVTMPSLCSCSEDHNIRVWPLALPVK